MSSETRPVPRRESPWGITGENHPEPKAHRCNDRVEDVIQACFEGNPFKTVPGPFKLFWQCMRSKPGEEPTEPFTYLDLDPPKRESHPVKHEQCHFPKCLRNNFLWFRLEYCMVFL